MVFVIAIECRDHEIDGRASKCSLNEQDRTTIRVQERHKIQNKIQINTIQINTKENLP